LCLHYYAAHAFGIRIPFAQLLTFLPVIFMLAALPVTVAHLGTTQAAWVFFFSQYAPAPRLLAFSLAAHLVFASTRALVGVLWLPSAYFDLVPQRGVGRARLSRLRSLRNRRSYGEARRSAGGAKAAAERQTLA
jgi:hypothetical protein